MAGNGGEYRKSYHGFASPVAYVVDSPTSFHVMPMQIDTWNRDKMNISGSPFVPGPLPRHSLAPNGSDALYSGLLECPLTDRVAKDIVGGESFNATYSPTIFNCGGLFSRCQHTVATAQDCFDAARRVDGLANMTVHTAQGASDSLATGCTISVNGSTATAFFNTKSTSVCCGAGVTRLAGRTASLVDVALSVTSDSVEITLAGPDGVW